MTNTPDNNTAPSSYENNERNHAWLSQVTRQENWPDTIEGISEKANKYHVGFSTALTEMGNAICTIRYQATTLEEMQEMVDDLIKHCTQMSEYTDLYPDNDDVPVIPPPV